MTLAIANLALAAYMTGVAWIVQVVHYPLFAGVGRAGWTAYEAAHQRRIAWVVGPPMLAAPVVAVGLVLDRPGALEVANLALCGGLLGFTLAVFAPLHDALGRGWSDRAHRRLVGLHAVRTAAWTAQAGVAVALLATG